MASSRGRSPVLTDQDLDRLADRIADRLAERLSHTIRAPKDAGVPEEKSEWHNDREETESMDLINTEMAGDYDLLSQARLDLRRMRREGKRCGEKPRSSVRSTKKTVR